MRAPTFTEFDALVVTSVGMPLLVLPPIVKAVVLILAVALVLTHTFAAPGWLRRALVDAPTT